MDRFSRRALTALVIAFAAAVGGIGPTAGHAAERRASVPPTIVGLDHIPIAVQDLEAAARRYRALGFVLKPGTAHDNGIRNQHAKFRDGTELELITAAASRDTLTSTYMRHLVRGDGPAFAAFFAPAPGQAARRFENAGLSYMFLGPRNRSPTDAPEHFAHPNGAESLISIWLADNDLSREQNILRELGAIIRSESIRAPDARTVPVAHFQEGTVRFLPGSSQLVPGRRVVGATVRVHSVVTARLALAGAGVAVPPAVIYAKGASIFLPPEATHGLWLELREEPSRQ